MTQRSSRVGEHSDLALRMPAVAPREVYSLFETAIGWVGLFGHPVEGVTRVFAGYPSPSSLLQQMTAEGICATEEEWNFPVQQRLQQFLKGGRDDFADVRIAPLWRTPFQQKVIYHLRRISYGKTLTYGELAVLAGSPGAARAVGQVMATNPVPFLVPCHRVLGTQSRLGGFSAPAGVDLKRRLLEMEGAIIRKNIVSSASLQSTVSTSRKC